MWVKPHSTLTQLHCRTQDEEMNWEQSYATDEWLASRG
jgi:hypothetical protein